MVAGAADMAEGWLCPKCGKVLAPWREECDHVIRMSFKFTIPAGAPEPEPLHPWDTGNDPRAATTWTALGRNGQVWQSTNDGETWQKPRPQAPS